MRVAGRPESEMRDARKDLRSRAAPRLDAVAVWVTMVASEVFKSECMHAAVGLTLASGTKARARAKEERARKGARPLAERPRGRSHTTRRVSSQSPSRASQTTSLPQPSRPQTLNPLPYICCYHRYLRIDFCFHWALAGSQSPHSFHATSPFPHPR